MSTEIPKAIAVRDILQLKQLAKYLAFFTLNTPSFPSPNLFPKLFEEPLRQLATLGSPQILQCLFFPPRFARQQMLAPPSALYFHFPL